MRFSEMEAQTKGNCFIMGQGIRLIVVICSHLLPHLLIYSFNPFNLLIIYTVANSFVRFPPRID